MIVAGALVVLAAGAVRRAPAQGFDLGGDRRSAKEMLADQFQQMATAALEGGGEPRPDQYQRARILLEQALDLDARDADRWQLRAELADRTDHPKARIEALGRYTDLRPGDDSAQLELITARLDQMHTIDARLGRLERILDNEAAQQLSASLRSRLASEAAAMAQELEGQTSPRSLKHLRTALDLDPSNDEAALMLYRLLEARNAGAMQQGAAAVHLTRAAPLDGSARRRLAEHLAEQGAYEHAAHQFALAYQFTGGALADPAMRHWVRSLGASGQTRRALQVLNQMAKHQQASPATQPDQQNQSPRQGPTSQQGRPAQPDATTPQGQTSQQTPAGAPAQPNAGQGASQGGEAGANPPANAGSGGQPGAGQGQRTGEQARPLPLPMELVRLALLHRPEQPNRAAAAFDRIWQRLTKAAEGNQPGARLELAWVAAVFNRRVEAVRPWLENAPADHALAQLARGWIALHQQNPEKAIRHFDPIASEDAMARFGLALARGVSAGDRARRLKQVVQSAPQSLGALMAARWLMDHDQSVTATSAGRSILGLMNSMTSELWRMGNLANWIDVQWQIEKAQFQYLQPIRAQLAIRNSTSLPLSIGANRTLRPQTLVTVTPYSGGQVVGSLPPMVVDAGRQLTLDAGQTMSVPVRVDRSRFGHLIMRRPFQSYVFDVTGRLNPRRTAQGRITTGPLGGTDTLRSLVTQSLPPTRANIKTWLEALGRPGAEQLTAIARLVQIRPAPAQGGGGRANQPQRSQADQNAQGQGGGGGPAQAAQQMLQQVQQQVTEQYQQFDPVRRAWTVRMIPPAAGNADGGQGERRFGQLLQNARRSDSTLVHLTHLATHVRQPDNPALLQTMREGTGVVQRFAEALRKGLQARAQAQQGGATGTGNPGQSGPGSAGGAGGAGGAGAGTNTGGGGGNNMGGGTNMPPLK